MSLLEDAMVECVIIDVTTISDGFGGFEESFVEGAEILAAFTLDSSLQAKIAEKEGVNDLYTITTKKNCNLSFHQIIKRVSDDAIFRVTSNGNDNKTPKTANLDMRQVSAELWEIPSSKGE